MSYLLTITICCYFDKTFCGFCIYPTETHHAEAVHQLRGDWVTELDLAIKWLLLKVVDQLHQALKLCCGAQQVHAAFLLDPAVFHLTITSERQ